MQRTSIKIAGEGGMGLVSVGEIISRSLKRMGYYIHSDREYMSLIKGGYASYQIDFDVGKLHALSTHIDIVMALDALGLQHYTHTVREGGIIVHGFERHKALRDLKKTAEERSVTIHYVPARQISYDHGGNAIMTNMVILGLLWKVLDFDLKFLRDEVTEQFSKKPAFLKIDLELLEEGYKAEGTNVEPLKLSKPKEIPKQLLISGTPAIALGAIQAGVRCYFAYPMTPSTGILDYLSAKSHETGMIVRQIEDEISVAQMALGAMFMGTRALCATSGGGFDLMTETVSLSAMIETPLVIIIAQRPGPATGLPTWTCQSDLNLAIHSSHGEFPRVVIAVSDPTGAYKLIQHALNFAEEFQIPVIVLTEKTIGDSETMVDPFEHGKIPIKRNLVTNVTDLTSLSSSDRFKITESGISKRWIPGSSETTFFGNGDEHEEDGSLTEESGPSREMIAKRNRKMKVILESVPEPMIYGPEKNADVSLIGWGSTKGAVLDAMKELSLQNVTVNYLHFDYLWPLKTEKVKKFFDDNKRVCLVEGNYNGQLGTMIEEKCRVDFCDRLLKWDGRPFWVEEIVGFVKSVRE